MEYIQTKRERLLLFIDHMESKVTKEIPESIDKENIYKPLKKSRKIIQYYNSFELTNQIQDIFNDLYIVLRKYSSELRTFFENSTFTKESSFKALKEASYRHELYLKELYYGQISSPSNNGKKLFEPMFNLSLGFYKNIPNTAEYIFTNMVQYRDEVYYIQTGDIFEFIYLYQASDYSWYWSPPKKTDLEDVWVKCPDVVIASGYWRDKKLFSNIAEYIIWLDIFRPIVAKVTGSDEDS
jgi:hypothetical protein